MAMDDGAGDAREDLHGSVSREHRRLGALLGELEASLERHADDPDAVRDAFAALSEQLDVHFEQEDRLYYPSLAALRPELAPQIRAIADAHRSFRLEIAAIGDALERAELAPARQRRGAVAVAVQRHEAREEALLQHVEVETAQAR
jgi:hypothetical protein